MGWDGAGRGCTSRVASHPGKDVLEEGQGQHEVGHHTLDILGCPCRLYCTFQWSSFLLWQPCSLQLSARTWPTANSLQQFSYMYASAISLQLLCLGGEALHMAIWEVVHGVCHLSCIRRFT